MRAATATGNRTAPRPPATSNAETRTPRPAAQSNRIAPHRGNSPARRRPEDFPPHLLAPAGKQADGDRAEQGETDQRGGQNASDPPQIEIRQRKPAGFDRLQNHSRNQKAGNDKEDVHPDIAAGKARRAAMKQNDEKYGDAAQPLYIGPEIHAGGIRDEKTGCGHEKFAQRFAVCSKGQRLFTPSGCGTGDIQLPR